MSQPFSANLFSTPLVYSPQSISDKCWNILLYCQVWCFVPGQGQCSSITQNTCLRVIKHVSYKWVLWGPLTNTFPAVPGKPEQIRNRPGAVNVGLVPALFWQTMLASDHYTVLRPIHSNSHYAGLSRSAKLWKKKHKCMIATSITFSSLSWPVTGSITQGVTECYESANGMTRTDIRLWPD